MPAERFPIEAGHVMMFARAIGDPNPAYSDLEADTIPAPPSFVQASAQFDPDYGLRPKIGQPWFGSGREATGVAPGSGQRSGGGGGTALHAEQHYEYHRPVVVGDVLHWRGRMGEAWEKVGRSGTLKFQEMITEYLDENDEVVVTARAVSVLTEGPK